MSYKKTKKKKNNLLQLLKLMAHYGVHIWAILIVANAALLYTYHFSTHAANTSEIVKINEQAVTVTNAVSSQSIGPSIDLVFSVPGIGSGGGLMNPVHLSRNVTVFLYAPNVNSLTAKAKPLYTIAGTAAFDDNQLSPTYTSFVNHKFDLGSSVVRGNYQIVFRTDQSLRTIIKEKDDDIGGKNMSLDPGGLVTLSPQTVLMGDIIPDVGDNIVSLGDYNTFISCYGEKQRTDICIKNNYGDFNDDSFVDGVDYNILIRSLFVLRGQGRPIPVVTPTVSPGNRVTRLVISVTPTLAENDTKKNASASASSRGSLGIIGGFVFFLIVLLVGIGVFVLYKKNEKVHSLIRNLLHLSDEDASASLEQQVETPTETFAEAPVVTLPTDGSIEKDCYVKTKGADEAGTGQWLLLTDDNGAIEAHYAKNDATDGFAKVKGMMKTVNGRTFLEIETLSTE
jgi:hypothetical protein